MISKPRALRRPRKSSENLKRESRRITATYEECSEGSLSGAYYPVLASIDNTAGGFYSYSYHDLEMPVCFRRLDAH